VLAPELSGRILQEIVPVYLADNVRARQLNPEGEFRMLHPRDGEPARRCQVEFLEQRAGAAVSEGPVEPGGAAPA